MFISDGEDCVKDATRTHTRKPLLWQNYMLTTRYQSSASARADPPANGAEEEGPGLPDGVRGDSNTRARFPRGLRSRAMSFACAEPAMPRREVASQLLRL